MRNAINPRENKSTKKSNKKDGLLVIVTDDGIGMNTPATSTTHADSTAPANKEELQHFGIQGMTSRAKNLHGEIIFNSMPNEVTEIKLFVPNNGASK